jgi:drug/metabolite transporter (DMT)-like permease
VLIIIFRMTNQIALYNLLMPASARRTKAILQAVFVTILWSTSWILNKVGLHNNLPPITFAGLRYTLTFICLALFVLFKPAHRMVLKQLTTRNWVKLALLGVVCYTLTQGA